MFENRIIYLLNKVLEPYIGGIDHNKLHLNNLLSGKVVLNGLHLKPCIVDSLNLPFHLTFGVRCFSWFLDGSTDAKLFYTVITIGYNNSTHNRLIDQVSIKIHFPILSLSKRKLVVEISDVIFLLTAIPESQWDPKAYREEYVAQKVATLAAESLQLVVKEIQGGGFLWKTLVSFLENLEVVVNNIHIRVEDYTTNPDISYAIGCVIKSAVFLSEGVDNTKIEDDLKVDTPFRRSFYNEQGILNPNTIHRNIKLNGVGLYIDRLDPLRAALMRNENSETNASQKGQPKQMNSAGSNTPFSSCYDHSAFIDAVSNGCVSPIMGSSGCGITHERCLARIYRHDRMRYARPMKKNATRREFRFKSRRAGDYTRRKVRCVRYWLETGASEICDSQKRLNVLSADSGIYGSVIISIMDYLNRGEHSKDCENDKSGWEPVTPPAPSLAINQERRLSTCFGSGVIDSQVIESIIGSLKKGGYNRKLRNQFHVGRFSNFAKNNRHHHHHHHHHHSEALPETGARKHRKYGSDSKHMENGTAASNSHRTHVGFATNDTGNTAEDYLGYKISSSSSWRILLSTFCEIQQVSAEQQQESVDMIHKAQMRYQSRNSTLGQTSSEEDSDGFTEDEENRYVVPENAEPSESTPDEDKGDSPSLETKKQADASSATEADNSGYNLCADMRCDLADHESDNFDENAFIEDTSVPLYYDEAWYTYHRSPQHIQLLEVDQPSETIEEAAEDLLLLEDPPEPMNAEAPDMWTRFTFVMNNHEDTSLKELFLRSIEETTHNYILNPKDFHGVASFYFCVYPTTPYDKSHSCWSSWGREREFKFQKDRMSIAKDYLPRCSVFLAFQNLNIVLSKDQYDCLMNLVYENIFKYFNWQSGIIYTFENPRASSIDEKHYMEYWPQYLLLGQNEKNNQLREFIKDFEILHSMQVIRILRSNASEALRQLIRRFGDRSGCGSCDLTMNECITDVLFSNICNQFHEDGSACPSNTDEGSKLRARLRMVGGIYEIVTKHAGSNNFLDSLRKICQPTALTLDFALDLTLLDSRVMFLFDMDSSDESCSTAKSYVVSSRGIHLFITDVYGRDGCQFIELEMLPFSLVSFCFNVKKEMLEKQDFTDCPCSVLDGPATLLLSCKDTDKRKTLPNEDSENHSHRLMPGFEKLKALQREIALGFTGKRANKVVEAEDSSLYLALSFNRFCTPEEADTRVLFHLNGDLFGHVRLIDELRDIMRHSKYNHWHHNKRQPLLVGPEKRANHLLHDTDGFYRECYELIDLGIEYSTNLVQGTVPYMNVEYDIQTSNQVILCADIGTSMMPMPYFLCADSVCVSSQVKPRLLGPNEESPYDTHLIRLSNFRVLRVNGDYGFMSDGGKRSIYLDGACSMQLKDYINIVTKVKTPSIMDDPSVSRFLSQFPRNLEVLSVGERSDAFIKLRWANSSYTNRSCPSVVTTVCLDTLKASIREVDILDILTSYGNYVALCNDHAEFMAYHSQRTINRSQADSASKNSANRLSLRTSFMETSSIGSDFMFYCNELVEFRSIVAQKWQLLQKRIRRRRNQIVNNSKYEFRLDYLYLELRRPINLDYGGSETRGYMDYGNFSEPNTANYSPRSINSLQYSNSLMSISPLKISEFSKIDTANPSPLVSRRIPSLGEENRRRRVSHESTSHHDPDLAMSRYLEICNLQDAIRCNGITLPLLSVKLTGIGAKIGVSDKGVDRMRVFLGSVEVEDQTNSVPIYLSTLFVGGDTVAFWRWLKVRREIQLLRSFWDSVGGSMGSTFRSATRKINQSRGNGLRQKSEHEISKMLKHVLFDPSLSRQRWTHDYDEKISLSFSSTTLKDSILRCYKSVENHIDVVMDYNLEVDQIIERRYSTLGRAPCFLTITMDYDQNDSGKCICSFSSSMANLSWEVLDEIIKMATRIVDYGSTIPLMLNEPPVTPSDVPPTQLDSSGKLKIASERWSIDTTVNVDQSSINVLGDSAWVGYSNFLQYMWHKMFRDHFNISESLSSTNSRTGSIRESNDGKNSAYLTVKEPSSNKSNQPWYNTNLISNLQNLDLYINSLKRQAGDRFREYQSKAHRKETHSHVSVSKKNVSEKSFSYSMRWMFIRSIFHEPHRNAYLRGPIYLRLSGSGTIALSFGSQIKELGASIAVSPRNDRVSHIVQRKLLLAKLSKIYSNYLPCALHVKFSGSNISAGFTRDSTGRVLSPCGLLPQGHKRPAINTESFRRAHMEFLRYTGPSVRSDHQYYGLLESAKQTLYDSIEPSSSLFIEPFRYDITLSSRIYGTEQGCRFLHAIPQCACLDVHFEAIKTSLTCADVITFCNLIDLANGMISRPSGGYPMPSHIKGFDSTYSFISIRSNMFEQQTSARDVIEEENKDVEDFHSCQSSDSGSDWVSVDTESENEEEKANEHGTQTKKEKSESPQVSGRSVDKPENQKPKLGLIDELLSFFNFGCRVTFDLLFIELAGSGPYSEKNVFTITLEDIKSSMWSDRTNDLLKRVTNYKRKSTGVTSNDQGEDHSSNFKQILTVSEHYVSEIDSRMSLCISGIQSLLTLGRSRLTIKNATRVSSNAARLLNGETAEIARRVFVSQEQAKNLLRFESHFLFTFDISSGSRQEMVMEPVHICFRGVKEQIGSKTLASLNTSWINVNISLNGARCVYSFLKYFTELSKIRTGMLETCYNELHRFQPAPLCSLDMDLPLSMAPLQLQKNLHGHHMDAMCIGLALTNYRLLGVEVPDALAFRLNNNILGSYGCFDVYGYLLSSLKNMGIVKLDAASQASQASADLGALTIASTSNVVAVGSNDGSDKNPEQSSYLFNNLGQPLAVCPYMQTGYDIDKNQKWTVIDDGEKCVLPVGYYGVLMPFVVRIQINNCVYEIPYSMLNMAQDDEFVIRLDISRRFNREMRMNRMGFINNMNKQRFMSHVYRFGVPDYCANIVDKDMMVSKEVRKKTHETRRLRYLNRLVPYGLLKKVALMRYSNGRLIGSSEKSSRRYAYIMVRTVQRTGFQQTSSGSASNHVSIYLSSTLWLSNKSQENLVVFPCVSVDKEARTARTTSLVWLFNPEPVTNILALSAKTVENNKILSSVKSVGNTLFKQLASIQDSKQSVKRLTPSHLLSPMKLKDVIEQVAPEYKLQYILLKESAYNQREVPIPLSWTIEPCCSIAACLQEDFPVDLNVPNSDYMQNVDIGVTETPPDLPPLFTADVLLLNSSLQYLYDSYENPRLKTPIPDYEAKVHLGNLDIQDLMSGEITTGFVQDIVNAFKSKEHQETRQSSMQQTGRYSSASSRVGVIENDVASIYKDKRPEIKCHPGKHSCDSYEPYDHYTGSLEGGTPARPRNCGFIKGQNSIHSAESAPAITMGARNNSQLGFSSPGSYNQEPLPDAYVISSKYVARLSMGSAKSSSTPTCSIALKNRSRLFSLKNFSSRNQSQSVLENEGARVNENLSIPPKSILSSTLIEVCTHSRSRFATKSVRSGIKNYKIALENCHVIENMMPYDIHIINPATYDYLNRGDANHMDAGVMQPFLHPIHIKASSRAQFAWYMRNGRFVMKELLSRQFTVKMPTDTVSVSSLVFDAMQPSFYDAFCHLVDPTGLETTDFTSGTLPRRLAVSIETSRKPVEPINDRNGVANRFLASSQIVYTLYADKWILSWLNYPISLCRDDARYKQTISPQSCTLVTQDLAATNLQLAIRKTTLKQIPNFDCYPKREKRMFFNFDTLGDTHTMSNTFTLPDFSFSSCDFNNTIECPKLHYIVATSMAPAPFFRTSVLEILPQTTLTNEFTHCLWLRETDFHVSSNFGAQKKGIGWYRMEPGVTLEFHSQLKGDLTVEITGIDPSNVEDVRIPKSLFQTSSSAFNIWSSGIGLKASNVTQLRYPSELRALKRSSSAVTQDNKTEGKSKSKMRDATSCSTIARSVRYGLCEVEIRIHRGAQMVRFVKPRTADWILLNTTGADLWIEQYGVPGYGEVVPNVPLVVQSSQDYAGQGVPFAYYDPFKEHKLVCRFHLTPAMFKSMSLAQTKGAARSNERYMGTHRWDKPIMLLNQIQLGDVIRKQTGRLFRMKGSLVINLSCVESMKCSSVFQIKYGPAVISVRLTAKTTVIFGQKTLHFTAAAAPFRLFPKFQKMRPVNFWNIYSELKNKLNVPSSIAYRRTRSKIGKNSHMNPGIIDFLANKLHIKRKFLAPCGVPSKYVDNRIGSFGPHASRAVPRVPEVSLRRRRDRERKGSLFNWDYLFNVNLLGLGTSICGGITEEILYISATLIKFMVTRDKGEHNFSLSLGWIQSDVHDPTTCYPTMLRPLASWHSPIHVNDIRDKHEKRTQVEPSQEENKKEPHVITIKFNTLSNKYFSLREITNCRIELEPLSLNLDTRIGNSILMLVDEYMSVFGFSGMTSEYFNTANVGIFSNVDTWLQNFDITQYPLQEVARSQFSSVLGGGTRYNISNLYVGKITLAINIRRSVSRFAPDMQPENVMIRYLTNIVKRTPHISDANIILVQESLLELCCTPYALLSHFLSRYITQSVQQIYKVLGAVDLIGNPKIVLHHWLSGFRNAMSHLRSSLQYLHVPPIMVFYWLQSASQLGAAFISGIIDACYRLTGSWYLLFNTLACNADRYAVVIMQDAYRNTIGQPSNIMEGIIFGGRSMGRNLYASLGNFALKPLNQVLRVFNCIKTTKGINTDVLFALVHILGALLSSIASLVFGTFSSLLSGISVVSQGIVNQIHSVPMLSAIRPQRSPKTLKSNGPMGYKFLESWSMNASRQLKDVKELMILLPMDTKMALFDPVYATTLHWSALSEHMAKISPIAFCRSSSTLSTYFWINRTEIGFVDRRRLRWRCENCNISSIEIFKVPATSYLHANVARYDDSIVLPMQPKVIKKHFSSKDTYYMRIVHLASNGMQPLTNTNQRVPTALYSVLTDESTFPPEEAAMEKLQGIFHMNSSQEDNESRFGTLGTDQSKAQTRQTLVQKLYRETVTSLDLDVTAISLDRSSKGMSSETNSCDFQTEKEEISRLRNEITTDNQRERYMSSERDTLFDSGIWPLSYLKRRAINKTSPNTQDRTSKVAEVVRLPSLETARLYFTLMVSVLKEATL